MCFPHYFNGRVHTSTARRKCSLRVHLIGYVTLLLPDASARSQYTQLGVSHFYCQTQVLAHSTLNRVCHTSTARRKCSLTVHSVGCVTLLLPDASARSEYTQQGVSHFYCQIQLLAHTTLSRVCHTFTARSKCSLTVHLMGCVTLLLTDASARSQYTQQCVSHFYCQM